MSSVTSIIRVPGRPVAVLSAGVRAAQRLSWKASHVQHHALTIERGFGHDSFRFIINLWVVDVTDQSSPWCEVHLSGRTFGAGPVVKRRTNKFLDQFVSVLTKEIESGADRTLTDESHRRQSHSDLGPTKVTDSNANPDTVVTKDFHNELTEIVENLEEWLRPFGAVAGYIDTDEARSDARKIERPVERARGLIVSANRRFMMSELSEARKELADAANIALDGVIFPDSREFASVSLARAHGSLWRGVCAGLLGKVEPTLINWDPICCDMWFGQSAWFFLESKEHGSCARAMAEWAEARQFVGDWSSAQMLSTFSRALYLSVDDLQAAVAVWHRLTHFDEPKHDSVILLGREPTREEMLMLVTVLGGRNAVELRSAMIKSPGD